jgi:hypothetical protein
VNHTYQRGKSWPPAARHALDDLQAQNVRLRAIITAQTETITTLRRKLGNTARYRPQIPTNEEIQAEIDRIRRTRPERPGAGTRRLNTLNNEVEATKNKKAA